eukprot:TRINITY_DN5868_c0_g2_i4.p2 TRINITY_DN5868_c0_g2~~TRINITY_DN5868_c0_g2_i4.p2  ORF type:complete len:118 (-),score=17.82 TRINITY_DN5868_c0_g2_i4:124-477(-)
MTGPRDQHSAQVHHGQTDQGVYFFANGSKYEGSFAREGGLRHGLGVFHMTEENTTLEGTFHSDGIRAGKLTLHDSHEEIELSNDATHPFLTQLKTKYATQYHRYIRSSFEPLVETYL